MLESDYSEYGCVCAVTGVKLICMCKWAEGREWFSLGGTDVYQIIILQQKRVEDKVNYSIQGGNCISIANILGV